VDSGPFQVMFVPLRSKTLTSSRAAFAAHQYSMWAIKALRAAVNTGETDAPAKPTNKVPNAKKITATDTATARMQLDAAATQAAAMAIRQQRQKAAAADLDALLDSSDPDDNHQQQQQLNDLKNDVSGGIHALDDFEDDGIDRIGGAGDDRDDYTANEILGDFTDDFEGMNAGDNDFLNDHERVEGGRATTTTTTISRKNGQILPENKIRMKNNNNFVGNDDDDDDYLVGDDFNSGGDVDSLLEESEDEYHYRAQQWEENPFGDGDDVEGELGVRAAAHVAGVA